MKPERLRADLRGDTSPFLRRRRTVIELSLFSMGAMGLMALYQTGVIRRVPEPRWRFLDSAKINGSTQAYSHFATPDAVLGLASYAATAVLAAMGPQDRSRRYPWMALAMAGKTIADAAVAGKLLADEAFKFKSLCLWCTLAAGATFAAAALSIPEARAAAKAL
jgi:uncharacterized membrane protein